jgi:hypothetical protein
MRKMKNLLSEEHEPKCTTYPVSQLIAPKGIGEGLALVDLPTE